MRAALFSFVLMMPIVSLAVTSSYPCPKPKSVHYSVYEGGRYTGFDSKGRKWHSRRQAALVKHNKVLFSHMYAYGRKDAVHVVCSYRIDANWVELTSSNLFSLLFKTGGWEVVNNAGQKNLYVCKKQNECKVKLHV